MALSNSQTSPLTLTFSSSELSQIEAFATLHGESAADFVRRVALAAAHVKTAPGPAQNPGPSWMDDPLTGAPDAAPTPAPPHVGAPHVKARAGAALFATPPETDDADEAENAPTEAAAAPVKRGVVGEPSRLAKGQGAVWEIRRALGQERIHGLGWTREQLAFVLKLSVVGVRKMEHQGTSPVKSLEARRNLLKLAQTLEHPTPSIAAFIAAEVP